MREVDISERHMGILRVLAQGDASISEIREHSSLNYIDIIVKEIRLTLGGRSIINTVEKPKKAVYRLGKLNPDVSVAFSPTGSRISEKLVLFK